MASATKYGWEFPDGTVIPADDKWEVKEKLLDMDMFWDINRRDCLRDGLFLQWYWDEIERDVDNMDADELLRYYDVKMIEKKDGGVLYKLPSGKKVDVRGLFDWITEEAYTYDDWYRYNDGNSYYYFQELVENEAEHLSEDPSEEAMGHYGIYRVSLERVSPPNRYAKPKSKAPAKKPAQSKSVKAPAKKPAQKKAPAKKASAPRRR